MARRNPYSERPAAAASPRRRARETRPNGARARLARLPAATHAGIPEIRSPSPSTTTSTLTAKLVVFVFRQDFLRNDLFPSGKDLGASTGRAQSLLHSSRRVLELRKGKQEPKQVCLINEPFRFVFAM